MALNSDPPGRSSCFYKKATAAVCACNLIAFLCIVYGLLSPIYFYSSASSSLAAVRYIWRQPEVTKITDEEAVRIREALEARRALEPVELIKRVKEIQEESSRAELKDSKSPASRKKYAAELTERLKQLKGANPKKNQQALEEWRRKKLESKKSKLDVTDKQSKNGTETGEDKTFGT